MASHPEVATTSGPKDHFLRKGTHHGKHTRGEYGRMGSKPFFCYFPFCFQLDIHLTVE
ncbi:uncharacterized protein G2W53_007996 [Senna tora]|uniref:Uncharacterized protein n=1 Tax=Senna tora TaxID=362788 RepID=A0A834X7H5_9FABA|nr:uncharacterized protein G2W53_007996 [Senna tora]